MKQGRIWPGFVVVALAALAFAPSAFAKTYTPNKYGDHVVDGHCNKHDCTLREAVIASSHHAGVDKIVLTGGKTYNLSRAISAGDETDGDLDIGDPTNSTTVIVSSSRTLATIDANAVDGLMEVDNNRVVFEHLKLRGGKDTSGEGGAIDFDNASSSSSKIIDCRINGNASTLGGAIDTSGPLVISHTKITGNKSSGNGGGINSDGDPLTLSQSTVAGNHSDGDGGGVYNAEASFKAIRSTISSNTASSGGGGILNEFGGVLKMTNDTIANNNAGTGGGVYYNDTSTSASLNAVTIAYNHASGGGGGSFNHFAAPPGSFKLHNSIIAKNTTTNPANYPDCDWGAGTTQSLGHNLIGNDLGCSTSLVSSDRHNVSARLKGLADNGGFTKTIALKKHSPAINHAGSGMPRKDQRGHKRHNPDIGSYER